MINVEINTSLNKLMNISQQLLQIIIINTTRHK